MIRIAVCCGGGFSSSALAAHLEKNAVEKGLSSRVSFLFIPYVHLKERKDEVDIAMLCPHLEWSAKKDADTMDIPMYIIPPRLYGLMPVDDFVEDAEDILAIWQVSPHNIMTFPDEPRPLAIKRMVSHRKWLRGEKADLKNL